MGLVVETLEDIGVTRLSRWIFNCYLIHDGGVGRPVVVDAGLAIVTDDLAPVMARLGMALTDLAGIFATHGHSDHVAGAPALAARSHAPVHLPARTLAYVGGEAPRSPNLAGVARIWPTIVDQPFDRRGARDAAAGGRVAGFGGPGGMRWPEHLGVGSFSHGEVLPGAPAWEAVAAPGHTDDSTAFWHAGTRTLLSGDAVLSVGGRAWMTPEVVDDVTHASTRTRLAALDVSHLLPGHGRPVLGDGVTAGALGPAEGPHGAPAFARGLVRCLAGH